MMENKNLERKNINRGFKQLRVWQDAIQLYVMTTEIFSKLPYSQSKVATNAMDAAHSISRNISEGYCRRSIKEYLNFLNYSLASCGELYSSYYACHAAKLISETDFEKFDGLHYKLENQLLRLIESLQKKQNQNDWNDSFASEPPFQYSNIPSE